MPLALERQVFLGVWAPLPVVLKPLPVAQKPHPFLEPLVHYVQFWKLAEEECPGNLDIYP